VVPIVPVVISVAVNPDFMVTFNPLPTINTIINATDDANATDIGNATERSIRL